MASPNKALSLPHHGIAVILLKRPGKGVCQEEQQMQLTHTTEAFQSIKNSKVD